MKYALLLVFEFRRPHNVVDSPATLISMDVDLSLAWDLCISRFGIPANNITIITDLQHNPNKDYSWERCTKIKRLLYPDIELVTREIAQFVENTIRGINDTIKGDETDDVFIYISGHGGQIPSEDEYDNGLIYTTSDGRFRKYLRNSEVFNLLFGQIEVESDGRMTVPITTRTPYWNHDGQ